MPQGPQVPEGQAATYEPLRDKGCTPAPGGPAGMVRCTPALVGSKEQRFLWGRSCSTSKERLGQCRAGREHKALGYSGGSHVGQVPKLALHPQVATSNGTPHRPSCKESQPHEALRLHAAPPPTPQEGGHLPTAPSKRQQASEGLVPSTSVSREKLAGKGAE